VKDPYKRLGISREASEDEIQGARNFLIQKYAGHKPSVDAIESAHDKIIMQKFYERKNPKIDIKKKMREVNQSKFVQAVRGRFQTPSTKFIIKTSVAFLVLGVLTVLFPTEEGPTLQVAISLIATMYFIHERLKSKIRSLLYGYAHKCVFYSFKYVILCNLMMCYFSFRSITFPWCDILMLISLCLSLEFQAFVLFSSGFFLYNVMFDVGLEPLLFRGSWEPS